MFELNDILTKRGLNPATVMVMRHRPSEPALRKALPWFAAEREDVFNAYQSSQNPKCERSLGNATHLAAFIGHRPGRAYGRENILGRWLAYAKSGHRGNKRLRTRDPSQFQFAVLELVSPTLPEIDVIELEQSWKDRLGTREFGLNDN